jgi:hypothetical protein
VSEIMCAACGDQILPNSLHSSNVSVDEDGLRCGLCNVGNALDNPPHASRIDAALDMAVSYGGIDGDHHKRWVIDQMVRVLTGCPEITKSAVDSKGQPYTYTTLGESPEYVAMVCEARDGEDGPETYEWDTGCAP